jgi:CBS domain-containing protein
MGMTSMPNDVGDVMTRNPVSLPVTAAVTEAAQVMRSRDVGDVIVLDNGKICGVVTDRDIVVRAVADNRDPRQTTLGDICSHDLVTLDRTATVDDAIRLMREHAVRRLPVTDGDTPIGIVSLGDLAVTRDPHSALADISAAPGNV